jgi:hypothetical protein
MKKFENPHTFRFKKRSQLMCIIKHNAQHRNFRTKSLMNRTLVYMGFKEFINNEEGD